MKSSLVSVSALVFSLLKNEWKFEEGWLVVDYIMENLMISTWDNSTCKKWNSFRNNIGKKEETSSNKIVTLTERNGLIILL